MTSGTATAPAADKAINSSDCVDRILKAVQERAISATEERTRTEVTRALVSRFELEISKLRANFDRRLTQVVAETETLAQLKLESTLVSMKETLREEILEEVKSAYQAKLDDAERLIDKLKEDAKTALNSRSSVDNKDERDSASQREIAAIVESEIIRVRSHLERIEKALADPATDLGAEIRLKRDAAELEAYLKGLRYSLGHVAVEA
jgi:hypothetical protein